MPNEKEIARILLDKKAVTLDAKEPYTYVSGIRSPIYCDNRKLIAFPEERNIIVKAFVEALKGREFDVLAGTATAGIPWASFVAQELNKPMSYIRPEKKEHGAGKQIEGADINGKKVIIIEDLISTGGSSFRAVEACRDNGADCDTIIAIFTYEMEKAKKKMEEGNCRAIALSNFSVLAKTAKENSLLSMEELSLVLDWNKAPAEWGPKHGFPNAEPKK
ncbi:orotate phosphoribosyltransferase [Candidatus Woesearchaeota archaeon]|nr:orotate phosphoribosyltransferase [Candidatus Woesearchaeota archaeon]